MELQNVHEVIFYFKPLGPERYQIGSISFVDQSCSVRVRLHPVYQKTGKGPSPRLYVKQAIAAGGVWDGGSTFYPWHSIARVDITTVPATDADKELLATTEAPTPAGSDGG